MNLKDKAYGAVRRAIMQGKLVRPENCTKCGSIDIKGSDGRTTIHAHHHDYTKPLDVEWICVKCHRKETPMPRYREEQPLIRGERNGSHVLKDADVVEIRKSSLTHRKLASIYGVNHTTIGRIKRGELRQWTAAPTAPIDNGTVVGFDLAKGKDETAYWLKSDAQSKGWGPFKTEMDAWEYLFGRVPSEKDIQEHKEANWHVALIPSTQAPKG